MNQSNIIIRFHGMQQNTRPGQLEYYLDSLLRHAPSKSTCQMHVFKETHGYLCKLTVYSNVKTFSSQFVNDSLRVSVKQVLKDVKGQIAKWKKNRSTMDLTGVMSISQLDLQDLQDEDLSEEDASSYKQSA